MPKKQSSTPILPIIIIFTIIAGGLFFLFRPQQDLPVTPPVSPQQEKSLQTSSEIDGDSPAEAGSDNNLSVTPSHDQEILLRKAPMEAILINPCQEATDRLDQFFTYLDDQDYIQKYQFPKSTKEILSNLINTLLKSPPAINGKTTNGSELLRNSAHIYRTLGAQNLTLLLKTMENEADLMEETCISLNEWFKISPQCPNHSYPLRPALEDLYEYAAFFLQTTGGQAYLMRRESALRLLAQYYSILIIHQAEQQGLNKYDINIASLLPHLIGELEESGELAGRNNYLTILYSIREQLSDFAVQQ